VHLFDCNEKHFTVIKRWLKHRCFEIATPAVQMCLQVEQGELESVAVTEQGSHIKAAALQLQVRGILKKGRKGKEKWLS